jgi:hypothetical protein
MVPLTSQRRFILAVLFGCAATVHLSATQLSANVILPNLPPGSQYQLLFVTADGRTATSTVLADYDLFVSQEAALNPSLPLATWHAIVSSITVDALDHAVTYTSIPLYNTHGELVANGTSDFWYPEHLAAINYDQYGILEPNAEPWTGTNPNGTANNPVGNITQDVRYAWASSFQSADWIASDNSGNHENWGSFYALSNPITVHVAPEPGTLVLLLTALLGFGAHRFLWRRRAATELCASKN